MKRIHANGIDIAYTIDTDVRAQRPWLVFSHSLAADHTMWDPQVAPFATTHNVLRYDTRGHGQSSAPAGEYSLDQLAADLLALLDALAIERCHLVGLSMGGMIAQAAALAGPRRFASLVLADTSSGYPPSMRPVWDERIAAVAAGGTAAVAQATLERWFTAPFRHRNPQTVARIDQRIRATPAAGFVGCAHAIKRLDLTARLGAITCPVLVIVGEDDPSTPPAMAETIVQAIGGAQLVRLAQAAHLSNLEQPERFTAAMQGFYSRLA